MARASRKRKQNTLGMGGMHDLNVPLVLTKNQGTEADREQSLLISNSKKSRPTIWRGTNKEQSALIDRLGSTGYSTIALSHEVHGRVKPGEDDADVAIPDSMVNYLLSERSRESKGLKGSGLKAQNSSTGGAFETSTARNLKILKRLNAIIEQESDLAFYGYDCDPDSSKRGGTTEFDRVKEVLKSYDLIAFSPRNETVLSAICNSQNLFYSDIIMLDYTSGRGGVQLPFKLKKNYVVAATKIGLTFELPYGPALIDPSKRKALVQASRQIMNASIGVLHPRPRITVSSGGRVLDGRDYGAMVLRSAGDIINFSKIVLGLNLKEGVGSILCEHAYEAVERGTNRKNGKICVGSVTYQLSDGASQSQLSDLKGKKDSDQNMKNMAELDQENVDEKNYSSGIHDNEDDEDGFLRL